jgi:biotin operon repressor
MQPGDVYKFALPRRDMKVVKDGVTVAPGLALGSWIAFKKMGNEAMVMGDLVLSEEEIEPVMLKLQQQGIEQTSIHNHLLGESPRVIYMHIAGHGDPVALAHSLAAAIALTKTPAPATTTPATPQAIDLQTQQVEQAIGYSGKVNGGILQFSVPRVEKITDSGMEVPPAMGTATAINFQPTGQGKAAISGDFVLLAKEVNPVIRALRTHGIEVEAMHNHMLFDQPHLYFMHFWANDDAVKLAQGLRAALDETNSQKPQVK